jgi:hypothetical protein
MVSAYIEGYKNNLKDRPKRNLVLVSHIIAVSANANLLMLIHDALVQDHHTLGIVGSNERLLTMLSQSPLHSIICVDLTASSLPNLLQLIPGLAQPIAFVFIGNIQPLDAATQALIQTLLIPTFVLPSQAPAFRAAIQQLAQRFP